MKSHNETSENLERAIFLTIEANDIQGLLMLAEDVKDLNALRNEEDLDPLFVATQKAVNDDTYMRMVKFLLDCGCQLREEHKKSPEELIAIKQHIFFCGCHDHNNKKMIGHYFKVAACFNVFINDCSRSSIQKYIISTENKELNPIKILFKTASMDKDFFNELVCACFMRKGRMDKLSHPDSNQRFLRALYNFMQEYYEENFLHAATLEKIGDALIDYHENNMNAHDMALYCYHACLRQSATNEHYERMRMKFRNNEISHSHTSSIDRLQI